MCEFAEMLLNDRLLNSGYYLIVTSAIVVEASVLGSPVFAVDLARIKAEVPYLRVFFYFRLLVLRQAVSV